MPQFGGPLCFGLVCEQLHEKSSVKILKMNLHREICHEGLQHVLFYNAETYEHEMDAMATIAFIWLGVMNFGVFGKWKLW